MGAQAVASGSLRVAVQAWFLYRGGCGDCVGCSRKRWRLRRILLYVGEVAEDRGHDFFSCLGQGGLMGAQGVVNLRLLWRV